MLDFINLISNLETLKTQGCLEEKLIPAYVHAEHFSGVSFADLKRLFDACDKKALQKEAERQGYQMPIRDTSQKLNPFTVFRGCVGSEFRDGMSWTTDLYQAIKYPKRAKLFNWYGDDAGQPCSVWCALVEKAEVYCYLSHHEPEFIACPKDYWRVDIPQELFEYNVNIGCLSLI